MMWQTFKTLLNRMTTGDYKPRVVMVNEGLRGSTKVINEAEGVTSATATKPVLAPVHIVKENGDKRTPEANRCSDSGTNSLRETVTELEQRCAQLESTNKRMLRALQHLIAWHDRYPRNHLLVMEDDRNGLCVVCGLTLKEIERDIGQVPCAGSALLGEFDVSDDS